MVSKEKNKITLEVRNKYGQAYDTFKTISKGEEALIDYGLDVQAGWIIELIDNDTKEIYALRKGLNKTRMRRDKYKRKYLKERYSNKPLRKENKQLKEALVCQSYCKYATKCNVGLDCSREEYQDMANANMKLLLENDSLKDKIESLEEDVEYWKEKYKELEDNLNNDYDPEIEIPEIHGENISW